MTLYADGSNRQLANELSIAKSNITRLKAEIQALKQELAEREWVSVQDDMLFPYLTRIQRKKLETLHQEISSCCLAGCDLYMKTNKGDCKVDMFGRVTWQPLPPSPDSITREGESE